MKTAITTLLLFFVLMANGQNNLQFNQAIRLSYSGSVASNAAPVLAGTFTVPANKVWKIESGSAIDTKLFTVQLSLTIDSQLVYSGHVASSSMPFYNAQPIWLGPGTYNVGVALITGFNYNFIAKISALEFNVVP